MSGGAAVAACAGLVALAGLGCQGAAAIDPNDDRPAFAAAYVAGIHEARGDHARAAAIYQRGAVHRRDATTWTVAAAEAWIAADHVGKGLRTLREAITAAPTDPTPRLRLARTLWLRVGNRQRALAEYHTAIEIARTDPRAHAALAERYAAEGNHRRVAVIWEQAAPHLEDRDGALDRAAWAWLTAGQAQRALSAWNRVRTYTPTRRRGLARAHEALADLASAIRVLDSADLDIDGWRLRGRLCQQAGRTDEAVTAWAQVVALDAEDVDAQLALGTLRLLELADPAQAAPHIVAARRLAAALPRGDRRVPATHVLVGRLAEHAGRHADAAAAYGLAYAFDPSDLELATLYGRALWRSGRAADALTPLRTAAEGIDRPRPWIRYGDALADAGQLAAARTAWQHAIDAGADPATLGDRLGR